jgi:hypothetical protein
MISIIDNYVDSVAPNSEAAKNGRGLVRKEYLKKRHISEDETILFGECLGSGKEPYRCSCDFLRPDAPRTVAVAPVASSPASTASG